MRYPFICSVQIVIVKLSDSLIIGINLRWGSFYLTFLDLQWTFSAQIVHLSGELKHEINHLLANLNAPQSSNE